MNNRTNIKFINLNYLLCTLIQFNSTMLVDSSNLTIGVLGHIKIYGFTTRMSRMGGALVLALENINRNNSILDATLILTMIYSTLIAIIEGLCLRRWVLY